MLNPNPGLHPAQRPRLFADDADQLGEGSWAHATGWEIRTSRCKRVSCVVVSSNQGRELASMLPRLSDMLTEFGYPWELIVVDIESRDDTAEVVRFWEAIPGVRRLRVDRAVNRMHGVALALQQVRGDVIVTCSPSDSRWSEAIPGLLLQWEGGSKLVCPAQTRSSPDLAPAAQTDVPLMSALSRLALLDRQILERLRITA